MDNLIIITRAMKLLEESEKAYLRMKDEESKENRIKIVEQCVSIVHNCNIEVKQYILYVAMSNTVILNYLSEYMKNGLNSIINLVEMENKREISMKNNYKICLDYLNKFEKYDRNIISTEINKLPKNVINEIIELCCCHIRRALFIALSAIKHYNMK